MDAEDALEIIGRAVRIGLIMLVIALLAFIPLLIRISG